MSDSVALVAVERVARRADAHVFVSENLIDHHIATKQSLTRDEARRKVLVSMSRMALRLAKNDEKLAISALTIVNGKANRLPQCIKLLSKYRSEVVKTAYAIKSELAVSDTSLRVLCQLAEYTDGDMEGEAAQLVGLLEEISMRAPNKKHQWRYYQRIREGLEMGRLIESLIDELRTELNEFERNFEDMSSAQKDALRGFDAVDLERHFDLSDMEDLDE